MAENLTLDEFVRLLRDARGPHRKVRLLARYWTQVQNLPAAERERVALALGSQALWNRLEALFSRDGTLSEGELAVKRALDSVGRADPSELRSLARKVRTGEYAEVGKELADVVSQALDEEAEESAPSPDASVEAESMPAEAESMPAEAESMPAEAESLPAETESMPAETAAEPGADAADTSPAADFVPSDDEADKSRSTPEPRTALDAAETDEGVAPEADQPAEPPVRSAEDPDSAAGSTRDLPDATPTPGATSPDSVDEPAEPEPGRRRRRRDAGGLSAAERLAELRRLRGPSRHGDRLGRAGRARLLDRLGPGWAARRALSQLIEDRAIEDLDEALALVGRLESAVQRSWCLADLVQHWELDEVDTERVLQAAPSPAARRRLGRRLARS